MNRNAATVGAVAVHLTVTLGHAAVHGAIPVPIADWQGAYAGVVLLAAPVVGAGMVARGAVRAGAWLVLAAGLAAFAFEGVFHFALANPDHVAHVGDGAAAFAATAALSTGGDLLLVGVGARVLAAGDGTTRDGTDASPVE